MFNFYHYLCLLLIQSNNDQLIDPGPESKTEIIQHTDLQVYNRKSMYEQCFPVKWDALQKLTFVLMKKTRLKVST